MLFYFVNSREKRQLFSCEKVLLITRSSLLKRCLAAGDNSVKLAIWELELALNNLFDRQLESSKIRSRAKWLEDGETPSSYFLRLENERHTKASVTSIFDAAGAEVFSFPEIMDAHRAFYTDLFSQEHIDIESQRALFSYVSSGLSEPEQALCEVTHRGFRGAWPFKSEQNSRPGWTICIILRTFLHQ